MLLAVQRQVWCSKAASPRGYCVLENPDLLEQEIVPLGQGMPDVQLLLVNTNGSLCAPGELGEIWVRSPHLAKGYLGDGALTQVRFITNPFTDDPNDRVYRTGDLGRYQPDGTVAFAGRADSQVQIRGFRVELGEVEAALRDGQQMALALLNAPTEAAGVIGLDGTIVAVNERAAQRFGASPRELEGRRIWDLLPKEVAGRRRQVLLQAASTRAPLRFEDKDHGRWHDNVVYPITDDDGQVNKVAFLSRDITDRVIGEEGLQEQKEEARLLSGLERSDEAVYNVPRLGKNYLRAAQHRDLIGILPDGRRMYEFHPWEKKIMLQETFVIEDTAILSYLEKLEARGEDPRDYESIWYYF